MKQLTDLREYFQTKVDDIQAVGAERLNICKSGCPFYQSPPESGAFRYSICASCGCVLEVKVLIPGAGCPQSQWAR